MKSSISAAAVVATALLSAAVPAAYAEPSAKAAEASPENGGRIYGSAFDGYRPYSDQPVLSWREANDRVGQIGGWRTYAKEAYSSTPSATHQGHGDASTAQPATAPASAAAPRPSPEAAPQGTHHNHGAHKTR